MFVLFGTHHGGRIVLDLDGNLARPRIVADQAHDIVDDLVHRNQRDFLVLIARKRDKLTQQAADALDLA